MFSLAGGSISSHTAAQLDILTNFQFETRTAAPLLKICLLRSRAGSKQATFETLFSSFIKFAPLILLAPE